MKRPLFTVLTGISLFFALSAYLIAGKASDPPAKFAMDRVRRIYPAFWIAVAVAILINKLLGGPHGVTWQFLLLLPIGLSCTKTYRHAKRVHLAIQREYPAYLACLVSHGAQ